MTEILSAVEKYGLTLVLLILFVYQYIKSNKETLDLVIKIKDEYTNNINLQTEAMYNLKEHIAKLDQKNSNNIKDSEINVLSAIDNLKDDMNEKLNKIEMIIMVRSEDK